MEGRAAGDIVWSGSVVVVAVVSAASCGGGRPRAAGVISVGSGPGHAFACALMSRPHVGIHACAYREFPGELQKILEWFRDYKMPDGKPANAFGFDNKCLDVDFTMKVVEETHGMYVALKSGKRANAEELSLI